MTDFNSSEQALDPLLAMVPAVIVTLGGLGLLTATRGANPVRIPGHSVKVESTHGAGDCLIGALGARLVKGDPLQVAAGYANAAAAVLVSTREADRPDLTKDATKKFLRIQRRT